MAKGQGIVDAAHSNRAVQMYLNLSRLWDVAEEHRIMAGKITEIRIKKPRYEGDEIMVIVKAEDDEGRFVAFSTGIDAPSALATALARADQEALKWRPDAYALGNGQKPPE